MIVRILASVAGAIVAPVPYTHLPSECTFLEPGIVLVVLCTGGRRFKAGSIPTELSVRKAR